MLAIKLKRIGKKGYATFRIIVSEKRSKVFGRFIEDLGWFNPHSNELKINKERIEYRLKNGAQPTDRVYNLLIKAGVLKGQKRPMHKVSKKSSEEPVLEAKAPEAPVAA